MKIFERRQTKKSFYSSPPSSHFFHLSICLPYVCLVSCVVLAALVLSVCGFDIPIIVLTVDITLHWLLIGHYYYK